MRHHSKKLNLTLFLVSTLFIATGLLAPGFNEALALWIVVASVFLIGIPHGAIDHIMASEIFGLNRTLKDHLLFYASYLLIMLLVAALWVFIPIAGMALFLIISVYHFGQADMEDFMKPYPLSWVWHLNRGVFIIGLIIFSDTSVTYPIMAEAMQIDTASFSAWMPDSAISIIVLIGTYLSLSILAEIMGLLKRSIAHFADSLLLIALLLITGPLIGFALYFALWHSAGHIREMREFFEQKKKSLSLGEFYLKALPFTLVSLFGLALLIGINQAFGFEEQFLSLMFILISVLTLPHMFIVDRMYREKQNR
ncbi:MAG: Brp/Blh family beta-carotene 15,15'-dioxygenase [Balneolaceae bacterium]|nr:Brp/Blh family beta-carotene 15,15'-dioxygenase [Balneolaceae bacterium]